MRLQLAPDKTVTIDGEVMRDVVSLSLDLTGAGTSECRMTRFLNGLFVDFEFYGAEEVRSLVLAARGCLGIPRIADHPENVDLILALQPFKDVV